MRQPHFLVTAGNTREAIDQARDWGNIFTGRTGLDIALKLLEMGDVTLVTSNLDHADRHAGAVGALGGTLNVHTFRAHADLLTLLQRLVPSTPYDAVCMTAAVPDYRPSGVFHVAEEEVLPDGRRCWIVEDVQAAKVSSNYDRIAVLGVQTSKLIDMFRRDWNFTGLLVKFKLQAGISETELLEIAEQSRRASNADLIVANTLEMVRGPRPAAWVVGAHDRHRVERAVLAPFLASAIRIRLQTRTPTTGHRFGMPESQVA
jgi:phosphopantothenoylcysteine synthetase/decarboxylase